MRILLLGILACLTSLTHAEEARVVWSDPSCPTFVARIGGEYGVYQARSGTAPEEGDSLSGNVTGEGIITLDNLTKGKPISAILMATSATMKALVYSMATVACQRRFQ